MHIHPHRSYSSTTSDKYQYEYEYELLASSLLKMLSLDIQMLVSRLLFEPVNSGLCTARNLPIFISNCLLALITLTPTLCLFLLPWWCMSNILISYPATSLGYERYATACFFSSNFFFSSLLISFCFIFSSLLFFYLFLFSPSYHPLSDSPFFYFFILQGLSSHPLTFCVLDANTRQLDNVCT